MNVTIRVTAPAGRLIPGIGSFEMGETFELSEADARRLVESATGLEVVQPVVPEPPRREKAVRSASPESEA
jgi:hypothetical protein